MAGGCVPVDDKNTYNIRITLDEFPLPHFSSFSVEHTIWMLENDITYREDAG